MSEPFTPIPLANLEAQTAFLASLNQNFATLAALMADVLSLSGKAPNAMGTVLDMDSNRIINLPVPVNPTDVVRLQDLTGNPIPEWIVMGSGAPESTGFPGQVYIDKTTYNLWTWTSAWNFVGTLQGPSGPGSGDMLKAQNLSGLASYSAARTNLSLVPGVNVQAFATALQTLSGASPSAYGITLLNAANAAAAQALLALGTAAPLNVGQAASTVAAGNDARFYNLTPNVQNTNYTFQLSDRGGLVLNTSATSFIWNLPPNVFNIGDVINVRASVGAGNITIQPASGVTLTLGGTSTNKAYTLAATGAGSIICEGVNTFYILGPGIS